MELACRELDGMEQEHKEQGQRLGLEHKLELGLEHKLGLGHRQALLSISHQQHIQWRHQHCR